MSHWLSMLQTFPALDAFGNTVGDWFASSQLICDPSLEICRKEVMEPVGLCCTPLPSMYGIPDGFRFRPPPLNMNVRIEGCSKMIPKPERMTVLPVPKTSQASPMRGETLLWLVG